MGSSGQPRLLHQSPNIAGELKSLPPKCQNQILRKIQDLVLDPEPGGSKTALVAYKDLYRVRAGDYRIIYTYDARVVQILTIRHRDEATYDDIDELEIATVAEYRAKTGPSVPTWEEAAIAWAAPKKEEPLPLPEKVTVEMLEELGVPTGYRDALIGIRHLDDLMECPVPEDWRAKCYDRIYTTTPIESEVSIPVSSMADLVGMEAIEAGGPLDAGAEIDSEGSQAQDAPAVPAPDPSSSSPPPFMPNIVRRLTPMKPYTGNTEKGIGKDARYSVKLNGAIQLQYNIDKREYALLTSDAHAELVALVNAAKHAGGQDSDGGGFVINEFRHVIVPTPDGPLYAGVYTSDLEFDFEGRVIGPVAPSAVKPGRVWPGPHVGVKYTLTADGKEIRYEQINGVRRRRIVLSDFHPPAAAAETAKMIKKYKPHGGAFYINEARELFAPVEGESGYERIYIGHLGSKAWFPEPT